MAWLTVGVQLHTPHKQDQHADIQFLGTTDCQQAKIQDQTHGTYGNACLKDNCDGQGTEILFRTAGNE
jgi:hypothetical protein